MAGVFTLSSSFLPSLHLPYQPKFPSLGRSVSIHLPIKCHLGSSDTNDESESKKNSLNLLKLSITLTVVSASLPQPVLAAKVSDKKRSAKKTEALSLQELKEWTQGLPVVANRIPYSEILNLKREGKLKRIIKPATAGLKQRPTVVLAVLEDSRVVRIVLPSAEGDEEFWKEWDDMKIDSVCVNAYSPPVKNPEVPSSYLGLLFKFPKFLFDSFKPKPVSKKVLELRKVREDFKNQTAQEFAQMTRDRLRMKKYLESKRKKEDRKKRKKIMIRKAEEALLESQLDAEYGVQTIWDTLAENKNFSNFLGVVIFFLFYQLVVVSYKKKKKDYEDRMKIQAVEAEEKRKMKELERERTGREILDGDELNEGGEQQDKDAYMKVANEFMRSGALVKRKGSKKFARYLDSSDDVKFTDVAGLGKIRIELEEIVNFFTHGDVYRKRGVTIPGGILLCGPPGVGKTLLAKAVAGEAGVNFFSISASQFVEMYVGVGASRVRALYEEAKENSPAVVFIDEIDAVGRQRGMIRGSGATERDATLNQLLVCLDGFQGRGNVITIASTNRPDILDRALVRPGRFDRKIYIPKPGIVGRIEILKVHARNKPMAEDVDYEVVARSATGMVGAELANVIEVAAINMMREGRTEITTDDLLSATQEEERGLLEKKEKSPKMWKQIASSYAAMAIVAINFPDLKKIEFMTIAPRAGSPLGYIRMSMDSLKYRKGMLSRQAVLDHITVQVAQRVGDEILYGEGRMSTLWSKTANNARSAARTYAINLSEKHYGVIRRWTKDRIDEIDIEALQILNTCMEQAAEILQRNRKLWDAVSEELVEKKSLTKQEFLHLVELYGSIRPPPPTIFDIRRSKLQIKETALGPMS